MTEDEALRGEVAPTNEPVASEEPVVGEEPLVTEEVAVSEVVASSEPASANGPPSSTGEGTSTPGGLGPGDSYVSIRLIAVMFGLTALTAWLVLYTMWAWWPDASSAANAKPARFQDVRWFGWRIHAVQRESLFFVVVAAAGFLGGLIHTIRSLCWYVGNRDFRWSWVPFNLMLPIVGALGGTVFYLVLRAGLFSPSTSVSEASPFGFAAVAVLVGLFSEHAMEKLRQVAANVFSETPEGEDHVPAKAPERPVMTN